MNTGKLDGEELKLLDNPPPTKTAKPQKLGPNEPGIRSLCASSIDNYLPLDNLKKLIYSKSPKEAAAEYLQSSRQKIAADQGSKASHQKSVSSIGKSERTLPYGFRASPERKDKQNEEKVEYDSAYTELAKKLYLEKMHQQPHGRKTNISKNSGYELLLSTHAAKEIENRKTIASKELQDSIAARLMKQGEALNEHNKALAEAYLQKEFEECTFNQESVLVVKTRDQ